MDENNENKKIWEQANNAENTELITTGDREFIKHMLDIEREAVYATGDPKYIAEYEEFRKQERLIV